MRIEGLDVEVFTIPTDVREADAVSSWSSTTLVLVHAHAEGTTGLGYSFTHPAAADLIASRLRAQVVGRDPMDIAGAWEAMLRDVRTLGEPGVGAEAISAIDNALWDLKARIIGISLAQLLGRCRESITVYGSGGSALDSTDRLQRELEEWVARGIGSVKMKVGRAPGQDRERVLAAREAIGPEIGLFVDASGSYHRKQALVMAEMFNEMDVSWLEEPVPSDDLEGLRLIRDRAPPGMQIAAGEYGYDAPYFERMLRAGAVDVLQADATRCLGISGFLQVASLCQAHLIPLSTRSAPSLHAHLACAIPQAIHVEYPTHHVRVENLLFDGVLAIEQGRLKPEIDRPGNGLELRRDEASRYVA